MNLLCFCIYAYLILKPFYIFKSGNLQPADFFLVFGFIFLMLMKQKKKLRIIINENKKFLLFIIFTFIINFLYFVIYLNTKFLLSTLYFIFNFMAIIIFSFIFDNKNIMKNISNICKFNILLQLLLYVAKIGEYYGSMRYMGTFNDPNQFSYYIFVSYMFIYLISYKYNYKKWNFLILIISLFLVLESASTGMLIGFSCFLILYLIDIIKNIVLNFNKYKYRFLFFSIFFISFFIMLFLINQKYNIVNKEKFLVFNRFNEKISRLDTDTSDVSLIQERGYDRFIYYPKYILYGSGEGEYNRFILTYHQGEIHATFPSILFYYGIIPFIILLLWLKEKLFPTKTAIIIPIIAIFLESFSLLNQRQVLFWVLIIFAGYINKTLIETSKKGDEHEKI